MFRPYILYEPAAVKGQISHVVMVLLEPRSGRILAPKELTEEYDRLISLAIREVADPRHDHFPKQEPPAPAESTRSSA